MNATNGHKIWNYTTGSYVESSPAVGRVVYFGSDDHRVYALNASSGVKLWSYATGGVVESSPIVVGSVVYVCGGSDVYALGASHTSLNSLFIIIGVATAVIITATIVFLIFQMRLKTKPKSPLSPALSHV